jgi:cobalt-zinc-cadmium efflux system protein
MKVVERAHQHPHTHPPAGDDGRMKRVLIASLALTLGFVVFEALAGFSAHSLALLSDAGHNFTDAFALLLAAFGVYLQARPGDHTRTYGYQRAGVLAAFVNALLLVLLAAVLFYESYQRLLHPEPVAANTMMIVAAVALLLNLGIAWALGGHGHHHHDLNVRAAWLHMAGDAGSSAAIIGGAFLIRYTGWQVIDPVLSILIGVAIVWSGWGIIRESLNILLEGLPKGLELKNVSGGLSQLPGVIDVHDLHIWSLGSESRALSCHVLIDDMPPSESDSILRGINDLLCQRFHILHTTIQFEHVKCILAETHCTSTIQPAAQAQHRH